MNTTLLDTFKIGDKVIHGRNELPPDVKLFLKKNGDAVIHKIIIGRSPLSSALNFALNITSLGQFKKKVDESPYDTLFHLFMVLETSKGIFTTEKEAVIKLKRGKVSRDSKTEYKEFPVNKRLTLQELFDNGEKQAGSIQNFISYSAKNNNCQDFLMYLLNGSGLADQSVREFVKQDTKKLFEGMDWFRKLTNTITDIGGRADVVTQGGSLPDYEHMKWGSFTKQFKAYHSTHPHIKDLDDFARHVVEHPKEFQTTTLKRARFYLNVIEKKHTHGEGITPEQYNGIMNKIIDSRQPQREPAVMKLLKQRNPRQNLFGRGIEQHHHHYYHMEGRGGGANVPVSPIIENERELERLHPELFKFDYMGGGGGDRPIPLPYAYGRELTRAYLNEYYDTHRNEIRLMTPQLEQHLRSYYRCNFPRIIRTPPMTEVEEEEPE